MYHIYPCIAHLFVLSATVFLLCFSMSHKTVVAPFLRDDDDIEDIPISQEPTKIEKDTVVTRDPLLSKKQNGAEGVRVEDATVKKQRQGKDGSMPPPSLNVVSQMFSKLVHQNATKAEVHSWCNSELEESNVAATKCLTEAFVR